MVKNADRIGAKVTVSNDSRVTKVGAKLRKYRLDEVPQLFNVLKGEMSLVGTRPESVHYVQRYTPEMMATLLLPAGVTAIRMRRSCWTGRTMWIGSMWSRYCRRR